MFKNVTGIILSGGNSSRMSKNKALLKIGNKTIIERVCDQMRQIFKDVVLITNTPDEYKFLDIPIYQDIYYHQGPLAGIHSGLINSKTETNFIISCDLPLITKELIEYFVEFKTNKLITVAKANGYIQQLAGIYQKECLATAENILIESIHLQNKNTLREKRGLSVLRLINLIGAEIISAESLPFYKEDMYFNMNSVADYNLLVKRISSVKSVNVH
jgi:molybdopterin-guanine dinucleotide biosynthesis protein A